MCHTAHSGREDGQPLGSRASNQVTRSPCPLRRIKQIRETGGPLFVSKQRIGMICQLIHARPVPNARAAGMGSSGFPVAW